MVLMFGQFFLDKQEARLLSDVDDKAIELLSPRFPALGGEHDPQLNGVRRMAEAVIGSVERLVESQAGIWTETIETAKTRWEAAAVVSHEHLEEGLTKDAGPQHGRTPQTLARGRRRSGGAKPEALVAGATRLGSLPRRATRRNRWNCGGRAKRWPASSTARSRFDAWKNRSRATYLAGSDATLAGNAADAHRDGEPAQRSARADDAARRMSVVPTPRHLGKRHESASVGQFQYRRSAVSVSGGAALHDGSANSAADVIAAGPLAKGNGAGEAAAAAQKPAVDTAELERNRDDLQWRIKQLNSAPREDAGRLGDAPPAQPFGRARPTAPAATCRSGRCEATARYAGDLDRHGQSGARSWLAELNAKIAAAKEKLEQAKSAGQKPQAFAVVPYDGKNGTRRRPIYIECRGDAVVLQPEGIVFRESDFTGSLGSSNALASCVAW